MIDRRLFLSSLTFLLAPLSMLAAVPDAVLDAEAKRIEVVKKVRPTVVAIFARGGQGGGSGVLISPDGYALSNFHVTRGAGDAMKCGLSDGKLYDAVIVGIDPTGDVALIKLLGRDDFPHAELGDSDKVQVGDWSFAMGNPFLLATDFTPTVTYGIVSGTHRYQYPAGTLLEYADCIQIDTSINPGNSGGPLFSAEGQLIGINGRGSFEKRGRVNVGVGYAISINQIKNFLGYLKSGRVVDHATLGARVGSDNEGRVLVSNILETSDAYRRGLRYDDEIIAFGGRPIYTTNGFKNVLGIYPKGWKVPIVFRREGERHEAMVRLEGVHRSGQLEELVSGGGRRRPPRRPQPQPKKEPEKKDSDKDKKDNKKDDAKANRQATAGMPAIVKKHYEKKKGFVNYYFNRINQERIWKALVDQGDFTSLKGEWVLTGADNQARPAEFKLSDKVVSATLAAKEFQLEVSEDLSKDRSPQGSGGLLAALHLWRRFLTVGLEKFGDIYYLGTVPVPGKEGTFDVLVGTHNQTTCHFYFDPQTGQLLSVEFFPEEDIDPCELRFDGYREVEGRSLPKKMEVRRGDIVFATFELNEFQLNEK